MGISPEKEQIPEPYDTQFCLISKYHSSIKYLCLFHETGSPAFKQKLGSKKKNTVPTIIYTLPLVVSNKNWAKIQNKSWEIAASQQKTSTQHLVTGS